MADVQRLVVTLAGSVVAAGFGALAVFVFGHVADASGYTAEVSGQVAVGTVTYGLIRQLVDSLMAETTRRQLHRRLSALLANYAVDAQARLDKTRDVESLMADVVELRSRAEVSDRGYYDGALRELRGHGATTNFSNLDDDAPVGAIESLSCKLR